MMTMRTYLILLLSILAGQLWAQTDFHDPLKTDYDRLRKEEKHDSALVVAKQMNAWALKNETDTSLRYAVSLRYVGNCFYSIDLIDSAIMYFHGSFLASKKHGSIGRLNSIKAGYNLALAHYYKSELDISEKLLLEISEMDSSFKSTENVD